MQQTQTFHAQQERERDRIKREKEDDGKRREGGLREGFRSTNWWLEIELLNQTLHYQQSLELEQTKQSYRIERFTERRSRRRSNNWVSNPKPKRESENPPKPRKRIPFFFLNIRKLQIFYLFLWVTLFLDRESKREIEREEEERESHPEDPKRPP